MKKSTFFVINLLIVLAIIFIPATSTFAADKVKSWDELMSDAETFINKGKSNEVINVDNYNNVKLVERISRLEDNVQELIRLIKYKDL